MLAGSSDQVDVFDYYGGRLQKAGKPKILVEQADLLSGDQQRRVARQLRSQVVNRVRLPGARRAVEQQALLGGEAEALDVVSRPDEAGHVAVEQPQRFLGQNDFFPANHVQPVHLHGSAPAGVLPPAFERDHTAPVGPSGTDAALEVAEEVL